MLELLVPLLLAAGCDVTGASLGQCGCDSNQAGQFTICASNQTQTQIPGSTNTSKPKPKPLRFCSYYANGTIDVPTITVITAWVEVGSRLCIGDEDPEASYFSPARTIDDDLSDSVTAVSDRPIAWWEPGNEIEFEDPATFRISSKSLHFSADLLGQGAQIRFTATSARWRFSDGGVGAGFTYTRSFENIGNYQAHGFVEYRVDYKIGSNPWVLGATRWELPANLLQVPVVEYPRRTLLVQG